jgi:hypothetical protein
MFKNHMHGMTIAPDATFGHAKRMASEAAREASKSYLERLTPRNGFVIYEPPLWRRILDWLGL